jgi:outer membrane protein
MKQFSLALNIFLLVAVGFLYYLHFKGGQHDKKGTDGMVAGNTKACSASIPVIAYVDQDSLSNNVNFIKNKRDELQAKQKNIEAAYENTYRSLEEKKNELIKKGNAVTQQEADDFQASQQQMEMTKQTQTQALAEDNAKFLQDMQAKLKDFLAVYNKQKKYTYILATGTGLDYLFYKDSTLNITQDVVKGLNDQVKTDNP